MASAEHRGEAVGSDALLFKDGRLIVHSSCEMPEWKATRYRKTAVVFNERTYAVVSRLRLPAGGCRYVLEPWSPDDHDAPGNTVHYGEAYVLERDALRREQLRLEKKAVGLFFVTWLLGFLYSETKLRLNERYAIHPVAVTEHSLFIEYLALIGLMVLLAILGASAGLGPAFGASSQRVVGGLLQPLPLLLGIAVLGPDLVIRRSRAGTGAMTQYGFYEWAFRRLHDEHQS